MLAIAALAIGVIGLRADPEVLSTANALVTGSGPDAVIAENNSPALVVNPIQPNNVVIVNRIDRPRYSAALHWSVDGGRTWGDTALPLPAGRDRPYAPDAAFAPDGVLYVSYVNLEGPGNDPQTLWLSRSTDGGRSLVWPVQVAGRYTFQARLVAGPGGSVHLTWVQGSTVGLLSLNEPAPVVMASSTDGGRTFGPPVQVSDRSRRRVGAASPVLDSHGAVDVLYEDFKGDARDFDNLDGPSWDQPLALVLARSNDQGHSFAPGVEVDSGLIASDRFLVYLPRFASVAADAAGSLYVAWADARSGSDQVRVRRSGDGGSTWGDEVTLPVASLGAGTDAWLPTVAVAPDGRVDVLYLAGHRDSGDGLINAYLATSADGAATFHTVRVSTSAFDSHIGPLVGPAYLPPDLGGRLGLHSSDAGAVASWVDTRMGTAGNGRQDIFAAPLSIRGAGVSALRWAAMVVMLVLAIGAALLATGGVARPRTARAAGR